MKIAHWALGMLLALPAGMAQGQEQQQKPPQEPDQSSTSAPQSSPDPLAEAARRSRELKKDQTKPAHVWNDENIPKSPNYVSVVGQTGTAAAGDNAANPNTAAGGNTAAPAEGAALSAEEKSKIESDLSAARQRLQSLQTDLDILKRTQTLDEQMFLSNPGHATDTAGAAKMKDEDDQIAAKQQDVTEAQKQVDELQAKLAKAGPAPSEPAPSNAPTSSNAPAPADAPAPANAPPPARD
jgi:hypothetical protein